MGSKHHKSRPHHSNFSSRSLAVKSSTVIALSLFITSLIYLYVLLKQYSPTWEPPFFISEESNNRFHGDLREAKLAWNKLCFGPTTEKLKLAVFSKGWPIGASPGGMERHASTLYSFLAARGHEIHVFTVPSDRKPHEDIHEMNLHVYFAANDHGTLNCTKAFQIYSLEKKAGDFDYVHTESVSLPHWRAKLVPKLAATWHGIWYEIMHSNLFQDLVFYGNNSGPGTELQEAMPRLIDEIKFFSSYTEHICISDSAAEVLVNIYQLNQKNVHIILNGVDETKFVHNPRAGLEFRKKHGVPSNASIVMGVAGRLVRDKGHPLLHEAFLVIKKRGLGVDVFLLVAGSGPWRKRYGELGKNVKILGDLNPSELSEFYNAIDVFVNPTLRPQGLDLTLMEAMLCGTPVLTTNFPSITRTVVLNEDFGYTFAPNVRSFSEALEAVIRDGQLILSQKGMVSKKYALSMFTATKMALAYERFFLCMKNITYCQYPLPTDC